jgi:hypothetical protein
MPAKKARDRLYGLPRDEFIAERNRAVKELREKGKADAAEEVAKLPKPTVAAWALNQAQRSDSSAVADLIAASRRVREAQRELLAGGDREDLDHAAREERRLAEDVAEAARAALDSPSEATMTKVRDTLSGLGLDDELAAELGEGRLAREHEGSGGFGLEAGMTLRPSKRQQERTGAKKTAAAAAKKREAAAKKVKEAEQRLLEADAALSAAQQGLAKAEAALAKAERAREKAERDVEKARTAASG